MTGKREQIGWLVQHLGAEPVAAVPPARQVEHDEPAPPAATKPEAQALVDHLGNRLYWQNKGLYLKVFTKREPEMLGMLVAERGALLCDRNPARDKQNNCYRFNHAALKNTQRFDKIMVREKSFFRNIDVPTLLQHGKILGGKLGFEQEIAIHLFFFKTISRQ